LAALEVEGTYDLRFEVVPTGGAESLVSVGFEYQDDYLKLRELGLRTFHALTGGPVMLGQRTNLQGQEGPLLDPDAFDAVVNTIRKELKETLAGEQSPLFSDRAYLEGQCNRSFALHRSGGRYILQVGIALDTQDRRKAALALFNFKAPAVLLERIRPDYVSW
jgi:hypothetical protein